MKKILTAMCLIASVLIVPREAAFCRTEPQKGSARDLMIKNEVETAISMLQTVFSKHQKGEMPLEQAKQLGADLLRGLRYGTDGYFWADTTEGVNVVLYGREDVEGKSRLDFKDLKGKTIVVEFLARAKAGGGYVDYWFPKEGQTTPLAKRGYVQLFEPFGWVVGTGYYLEPAPAKEKPH